MGCADYGSRLELTMLNYTLFFPNHEEAWLLKTQLEQLNIYLRTHRYSLETPPSFMAGRKVTRAQNWSGKILRWDLRNIAIV